jgi:hypothetical protein
VSARDADDRAARALVHLCSTRRSERDAEGVLESAVSDWGVAGRQTLAATEARKTAEASLQTALRQWKDDETARLSALVSLQQASSRARDAKETPGGAYLLFGSDTQHFYFIAESSRKRIGACADNSCPATLDKGLLDLEECVVTNDTLVWNETEASGTDAAPPFFFDLDKLTQAGVWSDLRDRDIPSAQAVLEDAKTKAEVEGEIFGVKVHQEDAVRWAWLPVLGLELFGILMLWRESPREAPSDWWTSPEWQGVLGLCALAAILLSLFCGLRGASSLPDSFYKYVLASVLAVVFAYGVISIVLGRRRARALRARLFSRR